MPWRTDEITTLYSQACTIIEKNLKVHPSAIVFCCSAIEFQIRFLKDEKGKLPKTIRDDIVNWILPHIQGKYWKSTHEIWLIEGRGEDLPTIIHELLHSIQNCSPHRESIVEYLTYLILESERIAVPYDSKKKQEWEEIRQSVGLNAIKQRLGKPGDCEDL